MRKGINPEKLKCEKNHRYSHRVIIPVYIPNKTEDYYAESFEVLDYCLNSLVKTIDHNKTAITIINNGSGPEIEDVISKYSNLIDKLVVYKLNKGKVYAVLSEARSAFEDYVTIADADVLFFSGWENEVFEVFNTYRKAGIVSPLPSPNNTFYFNKSLFFDQYLIGNLKFGSIVSKADSNLFIKGINYQPILNRPGFKYSWIEKQYYLDGSYKAIAGATHFVATYRSSLFRRNFDFPKFKFKKGYPKYFIDNIADTKGYYRLSTNKAFAYHIGNRVDDTVLKYEAPREIHGVDYRKIDSSLSIKLLKTPFFIKKIGYKFLEKANLFR